MPTQKRALSRSRRVVFTLVLFLIPATLTSAIYAGYTLYRTHHLYWYIKSNQGGWQGKVHRADPELGFAPVPGSRGAQIFPIGDHVPVRYDQSGFRVPVNDEPDAGPNRLPVVLTLGCSFTYGAATHAEDTYAYFLGKYLGATTRNAGRCSYGLAQMMMLARTLVPLHKPKYLIVQYSPWLVSRAQNPFARSQFGRLPHPYFFVRGNELALHPPVFMTKVMDLPADRYRSSPEGLLDRLSFMWNVGLPLFIHDDFHMAQYNLRRLIRSVPKPADDPERIVRYVYGEIGEIARANGARLVIVALGSDERRVPTPAGLFPGDSIVVNAQDALLDRLRRVDQGTYDRTYGHWRGSPSKLVDTHPNATAHRIIAEAISRKILDESEATSNHRVTSSASSQAAYTQ